MPVDDADDAGSRVAASDAVTFAERRRVPWWWWVVALVVAVPSVEVVAVYAPEMASTRSWVYALIALVVTVALIALALGAMSRSTVTVDRAGLRADGVLLPAASVGRVRVLDREAARLVLGRDARADAHLSIRPWVHTAVQIEVDDEADRTPYWVVGSRRPNELARALARLRNQTGKQRHNPLATDRGGDDHDAGSRRIEANSEQP